MSRLSDSAGTLTAESQRCKGNAKKCSFRFSSASPASIVSCMLRVNTLKMSKTKITINNNGSAKIDGDFEIVDMNGNAYGLQGRTIVSICRCGMSANKPFCDGSHKGHFEHEAIAFELPPKKV